MTPDATVAFAFDILQRIADDALLRSEYRTAARRHLRKLQPADK